MVIDIWKDTDKIVEDLPSERKFSFKSGVNIMFGCNNFCSYCIVPYVRGRERSRNPKDIIREIESLVADGVVEVMLLGQNVNSYGKTLEEPMTFAQLLQEIEKIEGLERIRFMTSHPKDLSDELIEVMAQSQKNLQASASSGAVRKHADPGKDEPALYKGTLSWTGGEDQSSSSGYFPDNGISLSDFRERQKKIFRRRWMWCERFAMTARLLLFIQNGPELRQQCWRNRFRKRLSKTVLIVC